MDAHLDESGRCPFTEQAVYELACIIAKAFASIKHSFRISPCHLGAGSAPRATVGCGPYGGRTCAEAWILRCLQLFENETCLCSKWNFTDGSRGGKQFNTFRCAAIVSWECQKRLEGRENRRDSSLVPDTMLISSRFHLYFSELVSRHFIVFMGSRPEYWRNELLYRADDIERHPGPKRARPLRGRDVPIQDILPTTA